MYCNMKGCIMNKENLVFVNDPSKNSFLLRCFFNEYADSYQECMAVLEASETSEQVISHILSSDTLKGSQVYAELSKIRHDHWKRVRDDIENWIRTSSDAGGLKVGNDSFSVIIPNGYGDGDMYVAVVSKGCLNHDMLNFWTVISGDKLQIYDYDCGTEANVINTLSGRYGVFFGYGFVVLEKWD